MTVPWSYCWRSLWRRRTRTLLTAAGIALPVGVTVALLALANGLTGSIRATGHPLNVIVTSRGAETVEFSAIDRGIAGQLRSSRHVAGAGDDILVSPEAFFSVPVGSATETAGQAVVRGVLPVALRVHDQIRLVEGRFPTAPGEMLVGSLAATQLGLPDARLQVGSRLGLLDQDWLVVGRFEAPGTAFESEIWLPLDAALVAARRDEINAVVLRARDAAAREEILFDLELRPDLRVTGRPETAYYAAHARTFEPVRRMVLAMCGLLLLGGLFIGANSMFAAMSGRTREIGLLRTIGFRRPQLGAAFLLEALLIGGVGGLLGSAAAAGLSGWSLRMPMGAFRCEVDARLVGLGLLAAAAISLLGAAIPILRALRNSPLHASRPT